jgi:hypothetical protein
MRVISHLAAFFTLIRWNITQIIAATNIEQRADYQFCFLINIYDPKQDIVIVFDNEFLISVN